MKKQLLFFAILIPILSIAQEEKKFGIDFHGFVKSDIFFDSRQTVSIRERHFLLWPKDEDLDADEKDFNAKSNFGILSIQSRLKGVISGPDAFGAKTSGLIEADFFGNENTNFGDVNGFRLRHAFAKLRWTNTELLVGQYWHMMFVTDCFPGVVSFNTGAPFQPFSRNPQVRLTQYFGDFKVVAGAMAQRDFVSTGPDLGNSKYSKDAVVPELGLQLHYETKGENSEILFGVGGNYLSLLPRLVTFHNVDSITGYKTDETVDALSGIAFFKAVTPALTFKLEGVYGQNLYHTVMLGGYGVESITDMEKDYRSYTPSQMYSVWTDIHTNGKKVQAGLFAGYTKNLGFAEKLNINDVEDDNYSFGNQVMYARGTNIDYIYRVAPRVVFNSGKLRFAFEVENTTAAYARAKEDVDTYDMYGEIQESEEVTNWRLLLGVYYFF